MTNANHATFFIERRYGAAPARVFAAWSEAQAKRLWFVEGKGWDIRSYELDFREGGREVSSFRFLDGVKVFGEETILKLAHAYEHGQGVTRDLAKAFGEETIFGNETVYDEIIPNERIIFTYSMSRNGKRFSVSLATVELNADGAGTRLLFTEHAAFFEGADGAQMREQGWRELLNRLDEHLKAKT